MNCFNDPSDVAGGISSDAFKINWYKLVIKLVYLLAVLMTYQKSSTAKIKFS